MRTARRWDHRPKTLVENFQQSIAICHMLKSVMGSIGLGASTAAALAQRGSGQRASHRAFGSGAAHPRVTYVMLTVTRCAARRR